MPHHYLHKYFASPLPNRACVCVCMCVCACVCMCVRACVCVCVYILLPAGFFRLQDVFDILEMFKSTGFCWENFQGLLPSSFIHISESLKFHLQSKTLQLAAIGEKTNNIMLALKKMIYIDIRYKSAQFQKLTETERYQT